MYGRMGGFGGGMRQSPSQPAPIARQNRGIDDDLGFGTSDENAGAKSIEIQPQQQRMPPPMMMQQNPYQQGRQGGYSPQAPRGVPQQQQRSPQRMPPQQPGQFRGPNQFGAPGSGYPSPPQQRQMSPAAQRQQQLSPQRQAPPQMRQPPQQQQRQAPPPQQRQAQQQQQQQQQQQPLPSASAIYMGYERPPPAQVPSQAPINSGTALQMKMHTGDIGETVFNHPATPAPVSLNDDSVQAPTEAIMPTHNALAGLSAEVETLKATIQSLQASLTSVSAQHLTTKATQDQVLKGIQELGDRLMAAEVSQKTFYATVNAPAGENSLPIFEKWPPVTPVGSVSNGDVVKLSYPMQRAANQDVWLKIQTIDKKAQLGSYWVRVRDTATDTLLMKDFTLVPQEEEAPGAWIKVQGVDQKGQAGTFWVRTRDEAKESAAPAGGAATVAAAHADMAQSYVNVVRLSEVDGLAA